MILLAFLVFSLCSWSSFAFGQISSAEFEKLKAPRPSWVQFDQQKPAEQSLESDRNLSWILIDHQIDVNSATEYFRAVYRIEDVSALMDYSQLQITFRPEIERIELHEVAIYRDKERMEALSSEFIKSYDNESEAQQKIYSGQKNLDINIKQVKVGDIIDYSYSRIRTEKTFEGQYSRNFETHYSFPLLRQRLRVITKPGQEIYYNAPQDPQIQNVTGGKKEYRWESYNVPAILGEKRAPAYAYVPLRISTFSDWREFAELASELFPPQGLPSEIEKRIEQWQRIGDKQEQLIQAAKYVQKEFRYLSLSIGSHGWKPHNPTELLANGYGDCKDKAYLLSLILSRLKIESFVVLVNAQQKLRAAKTSPGYHNFDHAIVQARIKDRVYWIDATQENDDGRFVNFPPYYGDALVLGAKSHGLTSMAIGNPMEVQYDLKSLVNIQRDGRLTLIREQVYRGDDAKSLDASLKAGGAKSAERYLVDKVSQLWGKASLSKPIDIHYASDGSINVHSEFVIEPRLYNGRIQLSLELIPSSFANDISGPRSLPLNLEYPLNLHEVLEVEAPGLFQKTLGSVQKVKNRSYEASASWGFEDGKAKAEFSYRSLGPDLAAAEVMQYLEDGEKMRNSESISISPRELNGTVKNQKNNVFLFLMTLFCVWVSYRGYVRCRIVWKKRAFRKRGEFAFGGAPHKPLCVNDTQDFVQKIEEQTCSKCRDRQLEKIDQGELRLDDKDLSYVELQCAKCQQKSVLYFTLAKLNVNSP